MRGTPSPRAARATLPPVARNIDTMYIVDRRTKDVVWEGTHGYKGGMAHSHEPEMIAVIRTRGIQTLPSSKRGSVEPTNDAALSICSPQFTWRPERTALIRLASPERSFFRPPADLSSPAVRTDGAITGRCLVRVVPTPPLVSTAVEPTAHHSSGRSMRTKKST